MIMETKLTVFTPSYNRVDLLPRLYDSLNRQTIKDFIWMIIDDGSTDNTKTVVEKWVNSPNDFEIRYYYKENGGLHTAYNEAIQHIDTELCVCIDSDDFMPDDAVEKILTFWRDNGSDCYAGIVGLDYDLNNQVIGDMLPNQKTVNLIDLLTGKYNLKNGDRTNVVRTELYKKYAPMKVFDGEKNFNPHYMHLQISQEYDFLVLNENLRYVDYQSTGMSSYVFRQYLNSPRSFAETRRLYLSFPDTSLKFKVKQSIHLASSCFLYGKISDSLKVSPYKGLAFFSLPFGIILSLYIKHKAKE